jgi:hypothetical protein
LKTMYPMYPTYSMYPMSMLGYNRYPNANNPVNVQQMMLQQHHSMQQVNLALKFINFFFRK